ncbi:MAG: hypothetical protein HC801_03675 [Nitrospira sp.]|nr:hypothetical protein [Nitrospira sp.]
MVLFVFCKREGEAVSGDSGYQKSEMNQTAGLYWYALRTKSRHEKLVRDQLDKQGIEPLLPTVKRLSQWKDRKKEIEIPLFSGYCFVRFSQQEKAPVQKVTGVVGIVGSGSRPEPIPEQEIEALRRLMTGVLPYDPHPYLHEGMQVEVVRGPCKGSGNSAAEGKAASLGIGRATHSTSSRGRNRCE